MKVAANRRFSFAGEGHDSAALAFRIALAAALLGWASLAAAADQSVWPLTPYQVRVFVAVAPEPPITPRLQSELCSTLSSRIDAVLGAAWNAQVTEPPPALCRDMIRGLATLQAAQIPLPPPQIDKILLVAVTVTTDGMTVMARDFDVRTHVLNTPIARQVWQTGALGQTVLDAVLSAFAPVARIESLEKDNIVVLRPKAIGLPLGDRKLAILRPGDVLQPITRTNDRQGNFRHAVAAPYSYCVVETASRGEARAKVYSGMRAAVNAKGKGRQESLALRVAPPRGATTLVLRSRGEPKVPLSGYEVYSYPPGSKTPTLLGLSDRQGRLTVTPDPAVLRVLLIKSGNDLLARLPMVPGLEPQALAELANQDRRLEAEGFFFALKEELVDLVARRKILMHQIRTRMDAGQFDQASKLMDDLNRLPKAMEFSLRISQQQERLASPDKRIQKRIDTLLNDTHQIIDQYLGSDEVDVLDRELRAARHETKADAAAAPKNDGKG